MSVWKQEYVKGKKYNLDEKFNFAQKCLEKALADCTDCDNKTISKIFFELGRSLFGQGLKGAAINCMLTSLKMGLNEPYIKNMIYYLVNEYGMPATNSKKRDDKEAFKSIQVMRYLNLKKKKCFDTIAEKDMILDLLDDAWESFSEKFDFSGLSAREKLHRYNCCIIIFPTINVIKGDCVDEHGVIYADFGENICSCGSGLPYMWCCGRIKTIEEIDNGTL